MRFRNSRWFRALTLFVLFNFVTQLFLPSVAWALSSGPTQPEYSSFSPVSASDMVNVFTGDFNYSIPVINVPGKAGSGYAMSLSYASGANSDQEASWVGLGWTLNAGAINRQKRGFPDEYDGSKTVTTYAKNRPNWTVNTTGIAGIELFSNSTGATPLSIRKTFRANNYYGYQSDIGFGVSPAGMATLNANIANDGQITFSAQPNFYQIANIAKNGVQKIERSPAKAPQKFEVQLKNGVNGANLISMSSLVGIASKAFGYYTSAVNSPVTTYNPVSGITHMYNTSKTITAASAPIGFERGLQGIFNVEYEKGVNTYKPYGYKYSQKAQQNQTTTQGSLTIRNKDVLMDYYTEKETNFSVRDKFVGIPFANYDQYAVSVEGLTGAFRGYHQQPGSFIPNYKSSQLRSTNFGVEVMVGPNSGIGFNLGFGSRTQKVRNWGDVVGFSSENDMQYRFTHDMGGSVLLGSVENNSTEGNNESGFVADLGLEKRNFKKLSDIPGAKLVRIGDLPTLKRDEAHDGTSTYIRPLGNTGFDITNSTGQTYEFHQPVNLRNETSLSIDVHNNDVRGKLAFKPLALKSSYDVELDNHRAVVGQVDKNSYPTSYLLTGIKSFNYVDADGVRGISQGDLGGWTKFGYRGASWYRYRIPFVGLNYAEGSLSDTKDDLGSVITGERQLKYLNTVETNSHIAYFITNKVGQQDLPAGFPEQYYGSQSGLDENRLDGLGAASLTSNGDPAANGSDKPFNENVSLEYLEKIVLFPKENGRANFEKPLKTVHLEYDYSLVPNVPNNKNSNFNYLQSNNAPNDRSGKLTLKKVWFEYEGKHPARISPYKFDYKYPSAGQYGKYENEYDIAEYADVSDIAQNPAYDPLSLGPWGTHMPDAHARTLNHIPWVNQAAYLDEDLKIKFDPAAYQLKRIGLPSGAEILVQYEEKDYNLVQNRTPMVMANLKHVEDAKGAQYIVNINSLGLESTEAKANELAKAINQHYERTGDKIYFKFLFALAGMTPSLNDCRSDYLTGYANFVKAEAVSHGGEFHVEISLDGSKNESVDGKLPHSACFSLVRNQRQGKLDNADCVDSKYEALYDDRISREAYGGQKFGAIGRKLLIRATVAGDFLFFKKYKEEDYCLAVNPELSFLKLPMITPKKATGARVKRVLTYTDGLESGDEVMYGTEYMYRMADGTTSGVATNEPNESREESPFVNFVPKHDKDTYEKLTTGLDKGQYEGPIGESMFPAASIGHRRVVVQSIRPEKTRSGFAIHRFNTVAEYPVDRYYGDLIDEAKVSGMSYTTLDVVKDFLTLPLPILNFSTSKSYASQAHRFVQQDMHGRVQSVTNYAGRYQKASDATEDDDMSNSFLVSAQEMEYFKPGETLDSYSYNEGEITSEELNPGVEMDVAYEAKKATEETFDFNIEIDFSFAMFPPVYFTVWPTFSFANNGSYVSSTSKVVRFPVVVKSTSNYKDGIWTKTENLAFNKMTGNPILTSTSDSYNNVDVNTNGQNIGKYYDLTIPAAWIYDDIGPKSENPNNANRLEESTASFQTYGVIADDTWFNGNAHQGLVSAMVNTYERNLYTSGREGIDKVFTEYGIDRNSSPSVVNALNKIYLPHESYVYRGDETSENYVSTPESKLYSSGLFDVGGIDLSKELTREQGWLKTNEVMLYSPNGIPLQEKNALGISNSVLFKGLTSAELPSMVASNAEYETIYFDDFEVESDDSRPFAHSGNWALAVGTEGTTIIEALKATDDLRESKGMFMAWVNATEELYNDLSIEVGGEKVPLSTVASTGDWTLMSTEVDVPEGVESFSVKLVSTSGESLPASFLVDDVRFQPLDAEASCYVYDLGTQKLVSQFDDQHFGLFYVYNDEGKLVAKVKETERGNKTLSQTHYNSHKESRN